MMCGIIFGKPSLQGLFIKHTLIQFNYASINIKQIFNEFEIML